MALALGLPLALSGCASTIGIGKKEYACPGMPEGVRCISARAAYQATEDRDRIEPTRSAQEGEQEGEGSDARGGNAGQPRAARPGAIASLLPTVDGPIPLRTPARIMRIRLNFWEDAQGDLHVPGYVYTEIEPRRWTVGLTAPRAGAVLRPLAGQPEPPARKGAEEAMENASKR